MHESWKTDRQAAQDAIQNTDLLELGQHVSQVAIERGVHSTIGAMQEMLHLASSSHDTVKHHFKQFAPEELRALAAMACVGFMTAAQTALYASEDE
jgi:hypothetical protein